ncbi:MAG: TetR/AcrR family transcriptional regulator [Candidatus Melainabacteria bacterium]|nr:TetR/AcrR family transcriptional regulator [Candidatus Melainabacteria bacterium]
MATRIEDTRDRITKAALAIFSSKGYASATTREIATEAGVNEVTLFRHFGSKENLLGAIAERYSVIPVIAETLKSQLTGDYRCDLKLIAHHILDVWEERRELIMIMMFESQHHPEEVSLLTRVPGQLRDYLAGYFSGLAWKGIVRPLNYAATAQSFISGLFTYFLTSQLFGPDFHPYSKEEYANNFVEIFVAGTASRV